MNSTDSRSDWVFGATAVGTAFGVLGFALFPLALPFLVLLIAGTLILALPVVAVAAVAGVLAGGAWLIVRAVGRVIGRVHRPTRRTGAPPAVRIETTARGLRARHLG